jgi:FdhE protein
MVLAASPQMAARSGTNRVGAGLKSPERRIVGGRIGDPTRETVGQPIPIILPDPATLFVRRADRLDSLAADHPMGDWLRFMAKLARAQHAAVAVLRDADPIEVIEGQPPLGVDAHRRDPSWRKGLGVLLRDADDPVLPDQARAVMEVLRTRDVAALETLADAYLRADVPKDQAGEAMYVAAALATYFAHRAAALPVAEVHLLPQRGRCPVCGSAPVAGVITAAGQAPGVRYLHCGLCATAWNHVRAMCITCGGSRSLALLEIDGGDGSVQAETCDECHSYAKMLLQAKDMAVDPMADDLASLGLDMLVGEAGYQRHAPNPLVIAPDL